MSDERRLHDPPAVVIVLPMEGRATIRLEAESFEDEQRLRLWLRQRSPVISEALAALEGREAA